MTALELTVRHVMDPHPVTVGPSCPVQEVLRIMNERRIGSVLVVAGHHRLAGIFTERDLLRRVDDADPGWRQLPVAAWMTLDPYTITPDVVWDEAVGMMEHLRVRHLPVLETGRVVGLVSFRMLIARRAEYLNRKVEERTAELRQANEQLLARDAEVLHYLRAAGRLQAKVMLPQAPPDWPELRWAVHYAPLSHLGGDYYDFAAPDPDHLGVLIADASGHSVPAALVAIMARFAFAEASASCTHTGAVLEAMNRRLHALVEERFVTAFYGLVDRRTGVLRYATAGHPSPLLYVARTGQVQSLPGTGFMLGIMPDEQYPEREVALEPGDRVCLYTDGLIEARNEIGELYGEARLTACLERCGREPAGSVLGALLADQQEFVHGTPHTDDVTVVVADIAPADDD